LKEFDAPNIANYIDHDTIDKIHESRGEAKVIKKTKKPE